MVHRPATLLVAMAAALVCALAFAFAKPAYAQCGVNQGNCCFAHAGRGCIEPSCCQEVCAMDPFCCSTSWDALCASRAQANCGVCGVGCGNPAAGNCCAPKATPACSDAPCCSIVCSQDPFCCDVQWDQYCAAAAEQICGACANPCGDPDGGDCCVPKQTPGCNNSDCCEGICSFDPFCCQTRWDLQCAQTAQLICGVCGVGCGNPSAGDCCAPHPTPACADPACCIPVCATDSYCCDVEWDQPCADLAIEFCGVCADQCGSPATGPCCSAHKGPSCDDAGCCNNVCAADSYCCNVAWDADCAARANQICGVCGIGCGVPSAGSCCTAHATPSCSDSLCCEAICTLDGYCCETAWDASCAQAAGLLCGPCNGACAGPAGGNCCAAHATPGCSDARCCLSICVIDPVCCLQSWDNVCAGTAAQACGNCGPGCGQASAGSCCSPHATPSCSNQSCCLVVCTQDPVCCEAEWDQLCANAAIASCPSCAGTCGNPAAGSCCSAHTPPACSNAACCALVCAADAYCCNVQWDATCAATARVTCVVCYQNGDLNGDGKVDARDLTQMMGAWGTPNADLNGDGFTGPSDLVILLNNWG